MKRVISFLLVLCMTLSLLPTSVGALETEAPEQATEVQNSAVTIDGTNSFGALLASDLQEQQEQTEEEYEDGYAVVGVTVQGSTATVEYSSLEEAMVVVGLYTEDGLQLLASGKTLADPDQRTVVVAIDGTIPQYFTATAYLVDTYDYSPLCTAYSTPMYTQSMQELLASTTEDYDPQQVLNLDDDDATNFAVFQENVIQLSEVEGANTVISADEEAMCYVLENPCSTVMSLQKGDILAYSYGDAELLILKVDTVTISGTTATLTGAELEMEEVFSHVKIENTGETGDMTMDTSSVDQGLTYLGTETEETPATRHDGEVSVKVSLAFEIEKEWEGVKFSGGLKLGASVKFSYYITLERQFIELKTETSTALEIEVSGKVDFPVMKLGSLGYSPVPGVYIGFEPELVVRFSVKLGGSIESKSTGGFSYERGKGVKDLTTKPETVIDLTAEGTVFFGVDMKPPVAVLDGWALKLTFKCLSGIELKAAMGGTLYDGVHIGGTANQQESIHSCEKCLEVELYLKAEFTLELEFLKFIKPSVKLKAIKNKIGVCHYSFDDDRFGWGECPNKAYRVTVQVKDTDSKPVPNVKVLAECIEKQTQISMGTTDSEGVIVKYLEKGNYILTASVGGDALEKTVKIEESVKINLNKYTKDISSYLPVATYPDSVIDTGHRNHCVCDGCASGVGEHACKFVVWTPISKALTEAGLTTETANIGALPSGNYYLDADLIVTATTNIGTVTNVKDGSTTIDRTYTTKEIAIDLNGHNITTTASRVFGNVYYGSKLVIADCVGTGTITGGTSNTGTVLYTYAGSTFEIYGGNIVARDITTNYGLFCIACDIYKEADGKAGLTTDDQTNEINRCYFNMYGGTVTGGNASKSGGTFVFWHNAQVNIFGGTITGGSSAKTGGNINISGAGTNVNIYGGTISGGEAVYSGGNIYVSAGKLTIYGGAITNGTSTKWTGGNIAAGTAITIKGGTITGGTAATYGNDISWLDNSASTVTLDGAFTTLDVGGYSYGGLALTENFSAEKITVDNETPYGVVVKSFVDEAQLACIEAKNEGDTLEIINGRVHLAKETDLYVACYCGGAYGIYHEDIGHTVCTMRTDWKDLNASLADKDIAEGAVYEIPAGRYYLSGDLSINHYLKVKDRVVSIDLNGYTLTTTAVTGGTDIPLLRVNGGELNICDSSFDAATGTFSGKVEVSGSDDYPLMYVNGSGLVRIYGGNLIYTGEQHGSGLIGTSGEIRMFAGYINGGKSTTNDASVCIYDSGKFVLWGGEVTGGEAVKGGNIYVGSGQLNIYGGTIYGGTADSGNDVFVANSATKSVESTAPEKPATRAIYGGEYDKEILDSYTLKTASFSGLVPGEEYLLLALVSLETEDLLAADNLLAVAQRQAGEDGTLVFEYVQRVDEIVSYVMACGASNKNLTDAEVEFPFMNKTDEMKTIEPVVTYDGNVLTEGVDYIVVGTVGYTAAGTFTCYIRGIYNYTGLVECTYTVEDADLTATEDYVFITLNADCQTMPELTKDLYVDLQGFNLTGTVTTNGYKIYGMDSTTDNYTYKAIGYMNLTDENGEIVVPVRHFKSDISGAVKRYMAIKTDDGYTFHRFYLGITHVNLRPSVTGFGYKAVFCGDEMVIAQLDEHQAYGFTLQLEGKKPVSAYKSRESFVSGRTVTLGLNNYDVEQYGETALNASVVLNLIDGTVIETEPVSMTMRSILEILDERFEDFTQTQLTQVKAMLEKYEIVSQWELSNLV